MSEKDRPPNILVMCAAKIPSVELGAIVPLSELQKRGLCVFKYKDGPFLSLGDIAWCDILFIVRGASSQNVWAATKAKELGRIVLGYWDDNLLDIPSHSTSYPYLSNPAIKRNINTLFRLTDAFFSKSPKLAAKLSHIHGSTVKGLEEPVGSDNFKPPQKRNPQTPIVGYSGSVDHLNQVDSLLGPAIAAAAATSNDFKVHIIGPKPNFIGRLPVETVYTPYIQNYYDYLDFASQLNWDIGLSPQIDCEFTNYKYHTKLLEYTHIGCAGIYSKLEIYTRVIVDGITGLLVDNQVEAWRDAILRLLKDPELRFKIVSNAYEFVQSHHSRTVVAEQYAAALEPFLNHRAPKIRKTYLVKATVTSRFEPLYTVGVEYMRTYGMKRFLWAALRYLFSTVRHNLFHAGSGK